MKPTRGLSVWLFLGVVLSIPIGELHASEEVSRLAGHLKSCEQTLAQRRLEEAGQDPASLQQYKKVEAAKAELDLAAAAEKQARIALRGLSPGASVAAAADAKDALNNARYAHYDALAKYVEAKESYAAYQSTARAYRNLTLRTVDLESQCASLRQRLAKAQSASQAAPPAPAPVPAPYTSPWPTPLMPVSNGPTDDMLSGREAFNWLVRNGYLYPNGAITGRFQDWQSRSHSSLSQSGHPLRGIAGYWGVDPWGFFTGEDYTILVDRNRSVTGNGGLIRPSPPPPPPPPPPVDAKVNEADRTALIQAIKDRARIWYATWCPKVRSGCAVVPNGARDELLQWARNANKQSKIIRIWKLLDCYHQCVMADPKSETRVNACRRNCQASIK